MEHGNHVHHTSAPAHADPHEGHHAEDFLKKFWVSLLLTIPILGYSEIFEIAFGTALPQFPGVEWALLALGSVIFFYGGWVFLRGAYRELSARLPGMMTLIALAITAAYLWSVYATLIGEHTLLWELSTLIAIMLLGHWIEMKAVASASHALKELSKLLPDTAEAIRDEKTMLVPLSELIVGDIVLVRPGAKVPADGLIVEGRSELDESIMTGESKPVPKEKGSEVIAGSINGDGSLTVQVARVGEQTFLAGIARLVKEAEASKSRLQILSDRAAMYLTVIAVLAGGSTFVAWMLAQAGILFATERLVAVLVIACPHALGLAVPLVASISTTMAARSGFLVKRRLALEAARSIDVVLFDKTGTLTEGKFSVTKASSDEALVLAAAVDARSEHPIAVAIVKEAKKRSLSYMGVTDFKRIPGIGAEGVVGGRRVFVGHRGGADIVVEADGKNVGAISVADTPRPEAKEAVDALTRLGVRIAMITGDSEEVARDVAKKLGIEEYFARVLPEAKVEKVRLLQKGGAKVAMVGDGVNDAPALAQSDLGIAIGAGTNVAIESAGIILVRNDPRDIPKIIKLSKLTYAKMLQNLFWATGYNIIALPLAAGALYAYGIILEPALAAILMSASTVIVAVNAVLLRRQKL
ncbi:MAG: copper-translocating P-type ATPase [Patescibacteria group bacterium]